MSTENAASHEVEILEDQLTNEEVLISKHRELMGKINELVELYGVNMLFAIHYPVEKNCAIEYLGKSDAVIEAGLQQIIAKIK